MSELRLDFSKAGAKKGLAVAMAFATALTSMGMSSMTTFASDLGATNPVGEESGGEEETPGEEDYSTYGAEGDFFSFNYTSNEVSESYGQDAWLSVNICQYGYEGGNFISGGDVVSGGSISGGYIISGGEISYDESLFTIKWYKVSTSGDQQVGTGNYYHTPVTEPVAQYYAVVTYKNGSDTETLTTKDDGHYITVKVYDFYAWAYSNYSYISVARGNTKTLKYDEIECGIPSTDKNLKVSYSWAKAVAVDDDRPGDGDFATYETIGEATGATYTTAPIYALWDSTETSTAGRAYYRETITYTYGEFKHSVTHYYILEVSNDGLDLEMSDWNEVFIPVKGSKTVTATVTADTDSKMYSIWYKDDIPYAMGTSGTKKITTSIKITEPGHYTVRVCTKKDSTGSGLDAYALSDAKALDISSESELTEGEAYDINVKADSDDGVTIYKFTPKYSTEYKYSITGTVTNAASLKYSDSSDEIYYCAYFYTADGEDISDNIDGYVDAANFEDSGTLERMYDRFDLLSCDVPLYLVVKTDVPYLSGNAPESAGDIEVEYNIALVPDYDQLCSCYGYLKDDADGHYNSEDFLTDSDERNEWYSYNTSTYNFESATTKADGYSGDRLCDYCGRTIAEGKAIKAIKGITLGKTSVAYTGKDTTNTITVKDTAGKVIPSYYYTVEYSNNKNIGTATVTVTFDDWYYSGTLKATYSIIPATTKGLSLTAASKGFTAKWTKDANVTGYEVQYATASSFKSAKTVSITKNSTVTAKVTKLTASKKYYVRVRSYKTVSGKKVYSAWSAAKTVTTKK